MAFIKLLVGILSTFILYKICTYISVFYYTASLSRVLEKLIVTKLARNLPPFMEPKDFFASTGSSPHFHILFNIRFNITFLLCLGLPSYLLPSNFRTQTLSAL
jgi:glycopeptide antibiotics resistance protein